MNGRAPCPHLPPAEHRRIAEEIDRACDFKLPRLEILIAIGASVISLALSLWVILGGLTP